MSLLRNITAGLRSLFRKDQVDRELDEELRAYQEMAAEEKMKDGLSRTEAFRAVRLELGLSKLGRKSSAPSTKIFSRYGRTPTQTSLC